MSGSPLLLGHWHLVAGARPDDPPLATHLHGRELVVVHEDAPPHWHWRVTSPHGAILAEGDAPTRDAAEHAAEDEATAVHPPTDELLEHLLR
jgi:hypothetical protein